MSAPDPMPCDDAPCIAPLAFPSPERVRELFRYEPDTGDVFWRIPPRGGRSRKDGKAGGIGVDGYWGVWVDGYYIRHHRLIIAWMTGKWPGQMVDHKNRDRGDNRWTNLREVTPRENLLNAGLRRDNISGVKGVGFSRNRWRVRVKLEGREIHVGSFKELSEATAARDKAVREHYGEFGGVA